MADTETPLPPRRLHWALRFLVWAGVALVVLVAGYLLTAWRVSMLRPTITADCEREFLALFPKPTGEVLARDFYDSALRIPEAARDEAGTARHAFVRRVELPAELVAPMDARGIASPAEAGTIVGEIDDALVEFGEWHLMPDATRTLAQWWVDDNAALLEALRRAGNIEVLGEIRAESPGQVPSDGAVGSLLLSLDRMANPFTLGLGSAGPAPSSGPRHLAEIPVPDPFLLRTCGDALVTDALVAAMRGDGARATDALRAMVGVGNHCGETPSLLGQLVSVNIWGQAWNSTAIVLAEFPEAFDDAQLVELEKSVVAGAMCDFVLDLAHKRLLMRDFAQRFHSDSGSGDGRLLSSAIPYIDDTAGAGRPVRDFLFGPVLAFGFASRAELLANAELVFAAAELEQSKPLWMRDNEATRAFEALDEHALLPRNALLRFVGERLSGEMRPVAALRTMQDRARIAIACERFRRANGRSARSLVELVPAFLAEVPVDLTTGLPYREAIDERGALRVWGIGGDGFDDGGRAPTRISNRLLAAHPVWRVVQEFHAREGRFPDAAELRAACAAEGVGMPVGAAYSLVDGRPAFLRESGATSAKDDIPIHGPLPADE